MNDYQPRDRRPIADVLRRTADLAVSLCVKLDISPNTVSTMSMVVAAGAGACFWFCWWSPWLVLPGIALCIGRLWLNMLDGMVALASGKASRLGELFNEVPDRVSDILIFAGVAHSGMGQPLLGWAVIVAAVFVAYIGLFGQAVDVGRQFGGVMTKPWRMVTLGAGAIVALILWLAHGHHPTWRNLSAIDITMIAILLGSAQTIFVRLKAIVQKLKSPTA